MNIKKIGNDTYGLMQLPYGTMNVIVTGSLHNEQVVILCNGKVFIREELPLYKWDVIGPVSQVCDIIITGIGTMALDLFLIESGLTEKNALLMRMNDEIVCKN